MERKFANVVNPNYQEGAPAMYGAGKKPPSIGEPSGAGECHAIVLLSSVNGK